MCGNNLRQIPSLHSVTTVAVLEAGVILSVPFFISPAARPHVLIFDVLPIHPSSLTLKGIIIILETLLKLASPIKFTPSTFIFFTDRSLQRCSENLSNQTIPSLLVIVLTVRSLPLSNAFKLIILKSNGSQAHIYSTVEQI